MRHETAFMGWCSIEPVSVFSVTRPQARYAGERKGLPWGPVGPDDQNCSLDRLTESHGCQRLAPGQAGRGEWTNATGAYRFCPMRSDAERVGPAEIAVHGGASMTSPKTLSGLDPTITKETPG